MKARIRRGFASPTIATLCGMMCRSLVLVAISPIVLKTYSAAEAAIWLYLITLLGLQMIFEPSISMTFYRAIGLARGGATGLGRSIPQNGQGTGQANVLLLSQIWALMRRVYPATALVTLIVLGALIGLSYDALAKQVRLPDAQTQTYGALAAFLVGIVARMYFGRHISYLHASGRITQMRWTEVVYSLAALIACLWVIAAGGGLFALALALNIPFVLGFLVQRRLANIAQRADFEFDKTIRPDLTILATLWGQFWRTGLGVAVLLLTTQGAGLYYARIGEPASVAAYLFAMSLMRPMMQFAQVPFFTKLPRLAELQAQGAREMQVSIAARGMRLSMALLCVIVLGIGAALWAMGQFEMSDTTVSPLLWAVIGLAACIERIGAMHLQLYSTTNHILWHWANGGAAVIFVICAALLLGPLGVLAFPLAHLISVAVFYTPYSMVSSYRAFALPWPGFELRASALPLAVLVIYAGLVLMWSVA